MIVYCRSGDRLFGLDGDTVRELVGESWETLACSVQMLAKFLPDLEDAPPPETLSKGGPGSGNFGHAGRPGAVGGSAPSEGGGESDSGGSTSRFKAEGMVPGVLDKLPPDLRGTVSMGGLGRFLTGTGFSVSDAPSGIIDSMGTKAPLNGVTSLTAGWRLSLVGLKSAVESLDQDSRDALEMLKPRFLMRETTNVNGRAWMNGDLNEPGTAYLAMGGKGITDKSHMDYVAGRVESNLGVGNGLSSTLACRDLGKSRADMAMDQLKYTAIHEIGHLLTTNATVAEVKTLIPHLAQQYSPGGGATGIKDWVSRNVSKYATTNVAEFIAESYLKYHAPNYVKGSMPKEWETMVENIPGNKVASLGEYVTRNRRDPLADTDTMPATSPEFGSAEWFKVPEIEDAWVPVPDEE